MTPEAYDEIHAGHAASQLAADGFISHYALVEEGGITLNEFWRSAVDHEVWIREHASSRLPPGTH